MQTAVVYGAGNIGRGFVGALMSQAGYQVYFVDVDKELVRQLSEAGGYALQVLSNEGAESSMVTGIRALDAADADAVADAIAETSLMATAVGARVLPKIAPVIALGIKRRRARGGPPLNIIICENLLDANDVLEGLVKQELTAEEADWFDHNIGLMEASIGRMVPIQTEQMRQGDPLRISAEGYDFLPVDAAACKGELPPIRQLVPYAPFDHYIRRKLFLHNMGHACSAYLGMYAGKKLIWETVEDPYILAITKGAMLESAAALADGDGMSAGPLLSHIEDLLLRFGNRALGDTCRRVGADIPRKLGRDDRLVGAALHCLGQGILPACIAAGIAAALYQYQRERDLPQTAAWAEGALCDLSGLQQEHPLVSLVMGLYAHLQRGCTLQELAREVQLARQRLTGPVV